MFRSTGGFDKLLEKATSNILMEPDWRTIIEICDLIRQNDVVPKHALAGIKKKLFSTNPHTAYYALLVLESVVKNCGSAVHEELTSKAYCETLHELAQKTTHENVRQKLLELIQAWTFAFRNNPKHSALKDIMNVMKTEGFKFPVLRESDAMFSADTAPEWADGEVCHRCRVVFNIVQRKHHCRACGQVFCSQCSQKSTTLPKFGIEKEVRVCDACYEQVTKPSTASKTSDKQESELPAEYLKSSLAQQPQAPPQKSEQELREEEELQLALALSQSEAEAKEKEKLKSTTSILQMATIKSETRPIERSPSPEDEPVNPELARYLNRRLWENRQSDNQLDAVRPASPSAPATALSQNNESKYRENGLGDNEIDEFVNALKSQVEIFVNRMKSNSSRGRSIANDSSVQTLFMNITAMHSKLLHYIQQHDDSRLLYERLQDKLTQVKDARAALDALREEHQEKLRRQAEEAERQRQLQMAHKLDIMRKKKQEYLQYQRQLALQRIQEQEREMQMRQEQQKQQYLMGGQYATYMGPPVHGQQFPPNAAPAVGAYHGYQYAQPVGVMGQQVMQQPSQNMPQGMSQGVQQMGHPGPQQVPGMQQQNPQLRHPPGFPPGPPPQQGLPQVMSQHGPPGVLQGQLSGQNMPPQPNQALRGMPQGVPQQMSIPGMPSQPMMGQVAQQQQVMGQVPQQQQVMGQIPQQQQVMGQVPQQQQVMGQQGVPQHFQQPGAPPASPQVPQQNGDPQTAELISFD